MACIGASRCGADKPSRWCCDLVGLPGPAGVSLAVCPSATSWSWDLGHDARLGCKWSSKWLLVSGACWRGGLMKGRAERLLSALSAAYCLGWSDSLSWRELHKMMPSLLTDCGAWGEGKGVIKVFLSFICSFLSLFKAEINQLYTRVHHSLLSPSICLFSSQ